MPYLWIKAAHITCVLVFIAGTVAQSFALRAAIEGEPRLVAAVRRWDRRVTVPAMLGVWLFGICLAVEGSWFQSPWLQIKLLFVAGLTGLHGIQAGRLKRSSQGTTSSFPEKTLTAIIAAVAIIAFLATVKPLS